MLSGCEGLLLVTTFQLIFSGKFYTGKRLMWILPRKVCFLVVIFIISLGIKALETALLKCSMTA
jgi:hypothetical protein